MTLASPVQDGGAAPVLDSSPGVVATPSAGAETRPDAVWSVGDLVVGFGSGAPVLNGCSVTVGQGECVALIGANGAGKSTLLRASMRLVEPSAGTISIFGTDLTTLSKAQLRRFRARVGFVFQRHNLVPRFSALTNVVHGALGRRGTIEERFVRFRLWHQALAPDAVRKEALAALDRVGLAHKALARAATLSGGQSQRVAIARTLMQRPKLMLADEPVASLDPKAGDEVMSLFVRLVREEAQTLLFTSHHMEHVLAYADRVIGLDGGTIVLDAPVSRLSHSDLAAFFESPGKRA